MEHSSLQQAVEERNRSAPTIRATDGGASERGLVTGVGFAEARDGRFAVGFLIAQAKEPAVEIRFDRGQLHWWAGRLDRLAQRAEWDLQEGDRGWLAQDAEPPAHSGPLH